MQNKPTTSLAKALRLMRLLGAQGGWMGVRELARAAGYTPSSTHGLLQGLLADDFVEFDSGRRQYRLGIAVLALADTMDPGEAWSAFVRPAVVALAESLDETVMALTWRAGRAVVLAAVEARHDLRVDPGSRIPDRPHLWASGQVLLAWRTAAERRAYAEAVCPDQAEALLAGLEAVRRQGFATAIDVAGSGVAAFGAPVLDGAGHCLLAFGASAPLSRASADRQERMRTALLAAATALAARLERGHHEPTAASA